MEKLKKVKNAYSILAVCLIMVGILLMMIPWTAVGILYKISGVILIIFGIVKLMGYFSKDLFQLAFQFDFAMGCISCLIGVLIIFRTKKVMEFAAVCIGIVMVVDALLRIQTTFDAKKIGIERWWILFMISAIAAVTGILLLVMPFKTTKMIIRLIGLNLCIDGILNLVIVQSTVKTFKKLRYWEV